jgi:hypothetical protein
MNVFVAFFLKGNHVVDTLEFDEQFQANSKDNIPNLRHILPTERGYLRELGKNDLGMVTSSTPSSAVDFESEDRTRILRKHQGLDSPLYHLYPF